MISKGSCFNGSQILDKKAASSAAKNKNMSDQQLAEELHKPIIRKFENEKYTHLLLKISGVIILLMRNW